MGHVLVWQVVAVLVFAIALVDADRQQIPNGLVVLLASFTAWAVIVQIGEALMVSAAVGKMGEWQALLSAGLIDKAAGCGVALALFLLARLISRGGLGAGDVKLYAVLGAGLGLSDTLAVILVSLVLSAVVGVVLMLMRKRTARDRLALAPFTFGAVLVCIGMGS